MTYKYIKRDFIFLFFKSVMVIYNTLNHPQAVLHLLTKELGVCGALRQFWDVTAVEMLPDVALIQKGLSNSITFIICQLALTSLNMLLVISLVSIAGLHGQFLYFSCLWWWVFTTAGWNIAKETLVSWIRKKPTFPTVCNNLAQKFLDQCFPGRSDVRVNSNAANSSVLVIINFSGNSCQLGWKAVLYWKRSSVLNASVWKVFNPINRDAFHLDWAFFGQAPHLLCFVEDWEHFGSR